MMEMGGGGVGVGAVALRWYETPAGQERPAAP